MENTLTSKRDELSNRIATAPVGQDVSSLQAARDWYNRAIEMTLDEGTTTMDNQRSLTDIAEEIIRDWHRPNHFALPYLAAMRTMDSIDDRYSVVTGTGSTSRQAGQVIVAFIGNASSWRGPTARRIKKELRDMLVARANG